MKVLVTTASRHGATAEIGAAIARTLVDEGLAADFKRTDDVESVDGYDALIIGSAVYVGHWLDDAKALVQRHAREFAERPIWIFSSGPVGEPPKPDSEHAVDVTEIVALVNPHAHEIFSGKIDPHRLGFGEKAIVKAVRAAVGDFRDWPTIERWARDVARDMRELMHGVPHPPGVRHTVDS